MSARWLVAPAMALGLAAAPCVAVAEAYEANPNAVEKDEDYQAGKKAIEKKEWAEAVRRLDIAAKRDPDNADIQNYLGYSNRNLKQFDAAFRHYKRSLALEPRHRGAHEYIGEAYLMVGDLAGAERHLKALREICLLGCEELNDLERHVKDYKARPK